MSDSPPPTPNSDHLDELMAGYVLDALSPDDQAELEQLLQLHPDLNGQLQDLYEVMGVLAYTTRQTAPARLRANIVSIAQGNAAAPPSAIAPWPRRWGHLPWKTLGGAIAATLILGLGIDNYFMRQRLASLELSLAEHHSDEDDYAFVLQGEGTTATATIILNADQGQVFVGVQNLPPLPADQIYSLWAFTDDQQPILCGQFNTNASGQWVNQIQVNPAIYTRPVTAMRISREPFNASPSTNPTTIVLTSETL